MTNTINPVTQVDQAFYYILGFSIVLLLGITAAMIYFAIKYRRENNPEPADIRGNWKLEVVWMTIPTIIALSMFYFGWSSYLGLRQVPNDAINIEVLAQKFSWIFTFPNDKETENELVVPKGKAIKLNITSLDVLHSLFIPTFRVKVDAVKGMTTYVWFYADREGVFDIQCTEFCGGGHSDMTAVLKIVSEAEYQKWLKSEDEDDEDEDDEADGNGEDDEDGDR